MSKHLKNIGLVSALTMLSRVLGLVRESVTAAVFGTGGLISAFFTGLTLPNLFRRLLAEGGMTAAFVPTLNDQLHARQRAGAFELVNQVMSWLGAVTLGIVLAAMLLFSREELVTWVGAIGHAEPATVERWRIAALFAAILFPYLFFVCLAAVFSAALQSLHRFLEPALSPIWLNLMVLGSLAAGARLVADDDALAANWLAVGWLAGGVLQMAVPALALRREGWVPRLDFRLSGPLRTMITLMVPTVFSSSIYLVNMSMSRFIGLSLNDDAVAVLNYAQRLMELPIGVFAVAVSTVVFPLISRFAAAGDFENLGRSYQRGMRLILLVNVPAAAGLAVLATPVIRVLFQHGEFAASSTAMMVPVLVASAFGLPFVSFVSLALRAFYARKDTRVPVIGALISFAVNIGLSLALMKSLSILGLAIASTAAGAVQAFYLQSHLARKQDNLAFHHLARDLWKIAIAAGAMAAVVATGWWGWTRMFPHTKVSDLAGIVVLIAVGVTVYGALVWTLRIEGRDEVRAALGRVRAKLGGGG